MPHQVYNTKFNRLTLAMVNGDIRYYIRNRLKKQWESGKIYLEINAASKKFNLDMIELRTLYYWIRKIRKEDEEIKITNP